jgi:hypothetical protein
MASLPLLKDGHDRRTRADPSTPLAIRVDHSRGIVAFGNIAKKSHADDGTLGLARETPTRSGGE